MLAQFRTVVATLGLATLMIAHAMPLGYAQSVTQIKLTEKQVAGLLAAQDDFAPLAGQLAEAADKPSADLTAKLDGIAKKHGFADFEEYRVVDNNIFLVLEGLDRESKTYVPPEERLKSELEEINKDTTIPDDDKKAIIAEINEELKMSEAVQHPENIALVTKHLNELTKLLPQPEDPALERGSGIGDDGVQQ